MTNITLQTNDEDKRLVLSDITGIGPDYRCMLSLQSHGFSCLRPFYFSASSLQKFRDDLVRLEQSLSGKTELRHDYEDDFIQMEGDGLGHIEVSGTIVENGVRTQMLQFSFTTDQTCLRALIRDVSGALWQGCTDERDTI